ncbi:tyrosine-type recombinase/integrase [Bradyrhizobium sp. SSUT112]|uniref:tyrosine-type recombinase/integrase n=1 Tax=Bradyrhizobium sp. SSUT112 TaxID=3040604 RepID=UPI00244D0BEC|nr:tyrosine-type recombinase/integrase [Bradyrhizobium sp. SSUT112]MDH2351170.1 tyrosine-type recombinase/integrase [Bradyrhizobium sp. SSUT112]
MSDSCYLAPAEVAAILAQPNRSTLESIRDHALLSFLYNSGARIQKALDLCPGAIRFDSQSCVRLTGKGRKERICPLWPETVLLLKTLLERQPRALDQRLFVNRYGEPLSASDVRFKLAAHVKAAAETTPTLRTKHVTPHSFRHVTAVHLVSAGVDVTVKALAKELGKARAMANILAAQSVEMRAKGEAMIQQADRLLCESWNERMWSDGDLPRRERICSRPRRSLVVGATGDPAESKSSGPRYEMSILPASSDTCARAKPILSGLTPPLNVPSGAPSAASTRACPENSWIWT